MDMLIFVAICAAIYVIFMLMPNKRGIGG